MRAHTNLETLEVSKEAFGSDFHIENGAGALRKFILMSKTTEPGTLSQLQITLKHPLALSDTPTLKYRNLPEVHSDTKRVRQTEKSHTELINENFIAFMGKDSKATAICFDNLR